MIKMVPFGRHNMNSNKSLPLVELPTRGIMTKIAQNNWLVEGQITWRTENSSPVGANQVETFVM